VYTPEPRDAPRRAALLQVDPDLGRLLPPDRVADATRTLLVPVVAIPRGPWPVADAAVDPRHMGLLVVNGLLACEQLLDDVASMELIGPEDVLRPWDESGPTDLLEATVRWSALADTRMAVIDRQVATRLVEYPEVYAVLMERFAMRARRLAMTQAISQLRRVNRRVLTLLWHLAGRWGKVTPNGVHLPLALSHRLVAQLIGARRPTVSTALAELLRSGELARGPGGTWVLTGAPVGAPDGSVPDFVTPRRATLPEPV
jgi:CRP/FNR family transcriptional regulator, cyclic AMP receptor protein